MNSDIQQYMPAPGTSEFPVQWTIANTWFGVFLLVLINTAMLALAALGWGAQIMQNAGLILIELAYLLPVVLILAWKRVSWKHIGFGRFDWNSLGLGCALLVVAYSIIIFHNMILFYFGIDSQGNMVFKMFEELESPVWFLIVGTLVAPLVEEIFFRGFLFQGFRSKYGWAPAILLSSAVFAIAHLDPASLIPTFVLGVVLAYVYHRSNSVWPGIVLHFLVNSSSLCLLYSLVQLQKVIPS
jgi:uncharacterized protein